MAVEVGQSVVKGLHGMLMLNQHCWTSGISGTSPLRTLYERNCSMSRGRGRREERGERREERGERREERGERREEREREGERGRERE